MHDEKIVHINKTKYKYVLNEMWTKKQAIAYPP